MFNVRYFPFKLECLHLFKDYRGYRSVDEATMASYLEGRNLESLYINEYVVFDKSVFVYNGHSVVPISFPNIKDFYPMNMTQKMAFHLLWNDNVPIKTLFGVAGSGKTRMAIRIALERLKREDFAKLLIVRQPTAVGDDLGYLKGTKDEKMEAWMKPIRDNMSEEEFQYQLRSGGKFLNNIEFDVIGYMLGRDLRNTIVLVDDAQMMTKDQMKMVGSRIGEGSVLMLCGDVDQIFADKYKKNNGMEAVWSNLPNSKLFGMIYLDQSVRSPVAELFATAF